MTDTMSFADAIRVVASVSNGDPSQDGGVPIGTTSAGALHVKYRVLLSRAADEQAAITMQQLDPAGRTNDVAEALGSAEFHADIYRHIDRLRAQSPSPVSWYFHLPRTAGSKFVADWRSRHGQATRFPLNDSAQAVVWKSVARELLAVADHFAAGSPVLFCGHIHFRAVDRFVRAGDSLLTTVRHPVARAMSLYRYAVAMCQNREIVNYPADDDARSYFHKGWVSILAAHGLNPSGFGLSEFVSAGLCPDHQYAQFFAHTDDVRNLGKFMRHAGFRVFFQESLPDSEPLVNATLKQQVNDSDRAWLESFLRNDLRNYHSIVEEYGADR